MKTPNRRCSSVFITNLEHVFTDAEAVVQRGSVEKVLLEIS